MSGVVLLCSNPGIRWAGQSWGDNYDTIARELPSDGDSQVKSTWQCVVDRFGTFPVLKLICTLVEKPQCVFKPAETLAERNEQGGNSDSWKSVSLVW